MNKTVRRAGALVAAGMLTIGLGACGDDDDADDSTGAGAAGDESAAADGADFCAAAVAVDAAIFGLNMGEGTQEDVDAAIAAAADAAPDEVADAVETMATETAAAAEAAATAPEDGPPPMPGEAFYPASVEVGAYLSENCDFESLDVTATEYAFTGIAESVPAGTTVINFDNQGAEFHEVAIMKVADGEERPVEELLALPEEEAMAVVTNTASVFGPPAAGTYVTADLEPGRYVAICFVPVGATPDAMESGAMLDGEPHFADGMVTEFEVA